jgi:L-2-hydroxyglutarate oxidase LhgO
VTTPGQVVVIGGGIVGLSTAMALTRGPTPLKAIVLEKEDSVGKHQTSHNSGVIHSGVYYRPGSLKARFTVTGAKRLVAFCREHDVPHDLCGKVIVATDAAELGRLDELFRRGNQNGVPGGVEMIGPERLREIEPNATGIRALHVPATGIVDFEAVANRFAQIVENGGGEVRTRTRVRGLRRCSEGWIVETETGEIAATLVVNCAGLQCDRIARLSGTKPEVTVVPFRGDYFKLIASKEHLVRTLIYPVPDPAFPFLGVHFTRMVGGGVEAGPNAVLALKREGYRWGDVSVRDALETLAYRGFRRLARRHWRMGLMEVWRSWSKPAFVRALQRLVPEVQEEDLEPAGAGVRAQALDPEGTLVDDFRIEDRPGEIHVLNAPSPAATASLAIGDLIASRARAALHASL